MRLEAQADGRMVFSARCALAVDQGLIVARGRATCALYGIHQTASGG